MPRAKELALAEKIKSSDEEAPMERGVNFIHILHSLRERGWRVAVHNDYRLNGSDMTFWLMTHGNGLYLKGEGKTDMDALIEIDAQARTVFAPVVTHGTKGD